MFCSRLFNNSSRISFGCSFRLAAGKGIMRKPNLLMFYFIVPLKCFWSSTAFFPNFRFVSIVHEGCNTQQSAAARLILHTFSVQQSCKLNQYFTIIHCSWAYSRQCCMRRWFYAIVHATANISVADDSGSQTKWHMVHIWKPSLAHSEIWKQSVASTSMTTLKRDLNSLTFWLHKKASLFPNTLYSTSTVTTKGYQITACTT